LLDRGFTPPINGRSTRGRLFVGDAIAAALNALIVEARSKVDK
jgi:hypothetical protein